MGARDTPRGLVVTIPDADFRGGAVAPEISGGLAQIASVVAAHPGLAVEVDGHTDSTSPEAATLARERADAVRAALIRNGLRPESVTALSLGSSRLIASNTTPMGREQNRRVEIVISRAPRRS